MTGVEQQIEEKRQGTKALPLWVSYLGFVFLGGALIAPALFFTAQAVAGYSPTLQWIAKNPFHRFVHRSMLLLAVVGLWPLCKALGIRWKQIGLNLNGNEKRQVLWGFLVGFLSLAAIASSALLFHARTFQLPEHTARVFTIIVLTALGVGLIEEMIFRGALFGSLRSSSRWKTALLISSAIYAMVHFFSKPATPAHVTWLSGFLILQQMLHGFIDLPSLLPAFVNLTLAGVILGLAYEVTGTLWFSIGLHVGWILWGQSLGVASHKTAGANEWFWGTAKLIDGWAATIILTIILLSLLYRGRSVFHLK